MKLLDVPLGLLINFHEMKVTDGINRLIFREQTYENRQKKFNRSKQRKRRRK